MDLVYAIKQVTSLWGLQLVSVRGGNDSLPHRRILDQVKNSSEALSTVQAYNACSVGDDDLGIRGGIDDVVTVVVMLVLRVIVMILTFQDGRV